MTIASGSATGGESGASTRSGGSCEGGCDWGLGLVLGMAYAGLTFGEADTAEKLSSNLGPTQAVASTMHAATGKSLENRTRPGLFAVGEAVAVARDLGIQVGAAQDPAAKSEQSIDAG